MSYTLKSIIEGALWEWQVDNFFVIPYPPRRNQTLHTEFVLDFKNNVSNAVRIATELVNIAIKKIEPQLRKNVCTNIVCIPPHLSRSMNVPCEQVAAEIQKRCGLLTALPGALRRTSTVAKSAFSSPGQRPTYDDHLRSIEYVGQVAAPGTSFIMLDDVYTLGNVSGACRDVLLKHSNGRKVMGLFLSRTR